MLETFEELQFDTHPSGMGGVQALIFFNNGYGASIVQTPFSYGSHEGKYEVAVMKGCPGDFKICYDTPITGDVLGYLDTLDVTKTLQEIKALPKDESNGG